MSVTMFWLGTDQCIVLLCNLSISDLAKYVSEINALTSKVHNFQTVNFHG